MTDLAHGEHVERQDEATRDLSGDWDSAPRKTDDDRRSKRPTLERRRKLPAGIEAIAKQSTHGPDLALLTRSAHRMNP